MPDPQGFLHTARQDRPKRPVDVRIQDWREVYADAPGVENPERISTQAGRCMDCGVPFCHNGCPLGNLIPDWNDLVWRGNWREAAERLHATNNFPEFTGRLCPAPCEAACVLNINTDLTNTEAVTIKQVEVAIADRAWAEGWAPPQPPERLTGKTVAIVGSGPAGLAAAQQLTRAGHTVVVYERDDRIGGLMRYGIPDFKQQRDVLDRRLAQMTAEGTRFRTGVNVGGPDLTGAALRERYDAVVLATGALAHRELPVPGRELAGIHPAMEYLTQANRVVAGDLAEPGISAAGRQVLIVGGGDTGADCLGTAHRQGAASVTQLQINVRPPDSANPDSPWPTWPLIYRTAPAYEEGGERLFAMSTEEFVGDETGRVRAVRLVEVRKGSAGVYGRVAGSEVELTADLVLLALGFTGPERTPLLDQLGVEWDGGARLARGERYESSVPGVFVAGDAGRGQSLIVWAIAEGRAVAAEVDAALMGETELPSPLGPQERPLVA